MIARSRWPSARPDSWKNRLKPAKLVAAIQNALNSPQRSIIGPQSCENGVMNPPDSTERRAGRGFTLVFALLAAGIATAGIFSYRTCERHFRTGIEQELSAIADLKVSQLAQWRTERLGDGSLFFQNAPFSALVRRFLEKPGDAEAQRQIQTWLRKCQMMYRYDQIRCWMFEASLAWRSPPAHRAEVASAVSQGIPEVLRSGRVAFQDF